MLALAIVAALACAALQAQDVKAFASLEWRFIGPANMGGRGADIEGVPGNPNIVYAGFGGGGLWKTTNGGHTWTPVFEKQGAYSIGDIAIEPGNPDVVWLGSGESNTRNSVSFGDGVYKTTDGGKTWKHMGLRETERISRVLVHPANPDIVYVGALGHAFGPHPDRGVFKTTDGGRTWQKVFYLDDRHGVADMDINPSNPNILYAALWLFERKPWTHTSGSEQGGVFRSVDGGQSWTRLTNGLPRLMGRIGVKVAPGNPRVVFVIAESKEGTLYRSDDGGDTFRLISRDREIVSRGFYYADLRVDPVNENRLYAVASNLLLSIDGGKSFQSIVGGTHIDYHALWIDPKDPRRLWEVSDGGMAVSYDAGDTWEPVQNIPLGQFYQLHADNRQPFYWVMGGLQDNGSWAGPTRTREPAGILNDDWTMVSFGDGFHMFNHPGDPDLYLSESQGGNLMRTDMRTREQQAVSVQPLGNAGGPASALKYRFNWNTPVVASPHDNNTVYFGGNVLFQSRDFGRTWKAISPDLTTNDREKQKPAGGPVWYDNSTAEYHCTIISVAESPLRPGLIWAGTDDGNLQLTQDGETWTNLIRNVPGLAPNSPVSHLEPSRVSTAAAYAAFDRHMFDDFRPYIFKTADSGKTWTSISANLPAKAYVHIVREDPRQPGVLYAGTELGLYISYDGGRNWQYFGGKNLPPVAVHDIVVHPRENDLILATHGRSIAVLDDVAAVQQFSADVAARRSHLFPPRPAVRFTSRFTRYGLGGKVFKGANPPYGALITYYLKDTIDEKTTLKIQILEPQGKLIRELDKPPREAGVQRVAWDLRADPPLLRRPPSEFERETGRSPRGPEVLPGSYIVRLLAGGQTLDQKLEVRMDPTLKIAAADLADRFEHARKLRDMVDRANRAARTLDSVREQLEATDRLMKDRSPDAARQLAPTIESWNKELAATLAAFANPANALRLEVGPRLLERLAALLGMIESVNAAPTPYQKETFQELAKEFAVRMPEVEAFLTRTIAAWNEALRKVGAPSLVVGKSLHRPQILVEPAQHFPDDLVARDQRVVRRVQNHVPLVFFRRSEPAEHRLLDFVHREDEVVTAVDHQDRDLETRGEVDGVGFRTPRAGGKRAVGEHGGLEATLEGEKRSERRPHARAIIAKLVFTDVRPGFQIVDRAPQIFHAHHGEVPARDV